MTDDNEIPDLFGVWLEETRKLQLEAYGNDLYALEGQDLRTYLTWNHTAAALELGELLEEANWKPWSNWAEGDPVIARKDLYIKEAVDALHFVANLLVAGRVTTEELNDSYRAKMQVNRDRQAKEGGYAVARGETKCQNCMRSFEDAGKSVAIEGYCLVCEAEAYRKKGL